MELERTQIMLNAKIRKDLVKMASAEGISISKLVRELLEKGLKNRKDFAKMPKPKEIFADMAKEAVMGPGDSDYDKYIYDYQ